MFARFKPGLVAVWLVCGIFLPAIVSVTLQRRVAKNHGVLVAIGSGSWYESSIQSALNHLPKAGTNSFEIITYIWKQEKANSIMVLRGRKRCTISLNRNAVFNKGNKLVASKIVEFPSGFSEFRLRIEPDPEAQKIPLTLLWSNDFISAEEIPANDSYTQVISEGLIFQERLAKLLGVLARLNVLPLIFWVLVRSGRFSFFNNGRTSRLIIPVMLVIFFLRFAGIGYQAEEGLHPDEKLYGGMIRQVRAGDLAPTQFWYTTGYFFITAASQKLAEWVAGEALPQNIIQRSVSAISSCLTCVLIFAIGRLLFSKEVAILGMIFFGLSFMPIELAHYGIVEPTMVFFFCLAFASLVQLNQKVDKKRFALAGLFAGLAVAVKQTAALIVLPFLITWAILWKQKMLSRTGLMEIVCWLGGAFLGFLILSPATILDFPRFYQYQTMQLRSIEGETDTHLFFVGKQTKFGALAWNGLRSGAGYPLMVALLAGIFLVWKKSRTAGFLLVPTVLAYLYIISDAATVPEHYVLLLCPFVALLGAVAVSSIPISRATFRTAAIAVIALLLLIPSLKNTFLLQKLLHGTDTRRQASEWCYENLPAGSRLDYDIFGPRFLIPVFDASRMRLFKRPPWQDHKLKRQPDIYVQDSITADVFLSRPDSFPVEANWYHSLHQEGELLAEFHGKKFRILNPDIRIYKIRK